MTAARKIRSVLLWAGLSLLALLVLIGGTVLWVINSTSGTRWAVNRARGVLGNALTIEQVAGSLAGPLVIEGLHYRDPGGAFDVRAERAVVDVELMALLRGTAHVRDCEVRGVTVVLGPSKDEEKDEPSEPFSLQPPIDIRLDRFDLAKFALRREDQVLVEIDTASAVAAWTDESLEVQTLDVRAPQGAITFEGAVSGEKVYSGEGRGRFRWQAGEQTYAGTIAARGRDARASLDVALSQPLDAHVSADVEQQANLPWKLELEVPTFDPRKKLMPDTSLTDLAATLNGSGDLSHATLTGAVVVSGETVNIERLRVTRNEPNVDVDAILHRPSGGTLNATGVVMLEREPLAAKLALQWQDFVIPESLAGQELHTNGQLDFEGSAQDYAASGAFKIGPAERIADIAVRLHGSPQQVQLEQLDIHQRAGQLAATGRIDLSPQLGWQITATARGFDPGAFAVEWPGDLNFDIASNGTLSDAAPAGRLRITNLQGRLRKRSLHGAADLSMTRERTLAGTLDVASGQSRVRIEGKGGGSMEALATIAVPDLADWLPDAGGALDARITARGRWPKLRITGSAHGSSLQLTDTHAESLKLDFDITQPTDPRGSVNVEVAQLETAGLTFGSLSVRAQGDAASHTLTLDSTGEPLAAEMRVRGARTQPQEGIGWSGSVEQLVLNVKDVARLSLQAPAHVAYSPQGMSLSQACLADDELRLCLAGRSAADGELAVSYSLHAVPLALAKTFAADLPVAISGMLDGEGNLRRTRDGQFVGNATLQSASGQIAEVATAGIDDAQVLLKYDGLRVDADLNGQQGRASVQARLNDRGQLRGSVELTGLGSAATDIRGKVAVSLPSIAVAEAFVPQLANVQGKLDVSADIAGTLDAPQIRGKIDATELATDLPAVGLKLRDGRINVTAREDGMFALTGGISSGKGTMRFDGVASQSGTAQINIEGQQFLAADIPGAHVLVEPKLRFNRATERMTVEGDVHIPSATIDLQKLPRTARTQAVSSDVVVIDAKTQEEARQEPVPLYATVRVTFADEQVALSGFGLDAKVGGQLSVREAPGAPTTGSGEVRVTGTYKAYGQDLKIRQGQLLFAGTPIDDPRLNIVAVREIEDEDVVAGLRVQGSARNPQLTVFSEPPLGQSNALSYLVTGKALEDVGSEDGDALSAAARSLSTATGGVLAKNIGARIGVDELAIKDSDAIGGAALTIGQYLSPKLYVSYGVGLFDPGEVVTVRYKLAKSLAFEALTGPRDSRAGLEYRIER